MLRKAAKERRENRIKLLQKRKTEIRVKSERRQSKKRGKIAREEETER